MNRLNPDQYPEPSNASSKPHQTMSLAGTMLVATPRLQDDLFGQSVCLVVEHDSEKSIGLLLNRPYPLDVVPLWKQITKGLSKTARAPAHLHFGGPVSGPIVAIHDNELIAEAGNGQGVYLAANVENLKKLAMIAPEHYRLCVGHSEWKSGQLEDEIHRGLWYPLLAAADIVFADNTEMWARGMRKAGGMMLQSICGLDELPSSPELN